jgi:hypothetical protein
MPTKDLDTGALNAIDKCALCRTHPMRGYQLACERACSAISIIDLETVAEELRTLLFAKTIPIPCIQKRSWPMTP